MTVTVAPRQDEQPDPDLQVEVHEAGGRCVLRLKGVLDAAAAKRMEREIDRLACSSADSVLVDTSLLRGIDDTGVNVLRGMREYAAARGRSMVVYAATGDVARALTAAHLVN